VTVLNAKVLVEGSKFLRLAKERALSKAGYEVSVAADGEEALRVTNDKLPDMILFDMMLPKISGTEVLKALTGNPATMNIPVILLTSLRQRNEGKLLDAGAVAYFENPLWISTRVPIGSPLLLRRSSVESPAKTSAQPKP